MITDGFGNMTALRELLHTLCTPSEQLVSISNLEDRLALAVSSESLVPTLSYSIPRQRWRKAIAHAIYHLRQAKISVGTSTFPFG